MVEIYARRPWVLLVVFLALVEAVGIALFFAIAVYNALNEPDPFYWQWITKGPTENYHSIYILENIFGNLTLASRLSLRFKL